METSWPGELQPFKNCSEQAVLELTGKGTCSRDAVVALPSLLAPGPIHRLALHERTSAVAWVSPPEVCRPGTAWRFDASLHRSMPSGLAPLPARKRWTLEHSDNAGIVLTVLLACPLEFCLAS